MDQSRKKSGVSLTSLLPNRVWVLQWSRNEEQNKTESLITFFFLSNESSSSGVDRSQNGTNNKREWGNDGMMNMNQWLIAKGCKGMCAKTTSISLPVHCACPRNRHLSPISLSPPRSFFSYFCSFLFQGTTRYGSTIRAFLLSRVFQPVLLAWSILTRQDTIRTRKGNNRKDTTIFTIGGCNGSNTLGYSNSSLTTAMVQNTRK
ncbi:hypothetical protein K457DRAFT_708850 [Linnemannia elongata AG-77]|uniref:Uncharacterized protein n=1 Tax=Linnemannia elongata AG-77 TaxID=1314771 RepID=A0A197KDC5_9FUNG|nr:hypothetical protein K457DRAFT_708850 [Linnemannia elongata AG-77]